MRLGDLYSSTQRSIKSNRLRSNLTVAIITIGITALICIITVIQILESTIKHNFSSMGANTFSIKPEAFIAEGNKRQAHRKKPSSDITISFNQAIQFKRNYSYPSTVGLSILASRAATVKTKKKKSNPNITVLGIDQYYLDIADAGLSAGRNFSALDVSRSENTCLIGSEIGERYFGSATKAINDYIQIGDAKYLVLGVLESVGSSLINKTDNQVFITLTNARQHYNLSNTSVWISIKVHDVKYMALATDEAEGQMRAVKKLRFNEDNNFSIQTNDALASMLIRNIKDVTVAAAAIGLITLLGAAIGLMNIMLVAVAERTREIGISKAIGADNATIRQQFLSEAVYISLKGGLLGVIIGILLGNLVSLALGSSFVIPWLWILIGLSTCFIVGLGAGLYPAIRAANLKPIDALRYE